MYFFKAKYRKEERESFGLLHGPKPSFPTYLADTQFLAKTSSKFFIDMGRGFIYFFSGFVEIMRSILSTIVKYTPIILEEFKQNIIEFSYIANGLFYWFAYESANLLSNTFVLLGKMFIKLADYSDKLARYLFPKTIRYIK